MTQRVSHRTLDQLIQGNTSKPKKYAKKSEVKLVLPRKNLRRFKFLVKSKMPYSDPKGHLTSILYPKVDLERAYFLSQGGTPQDARVKVWCTCPAWQYWGAAYNSTKNKYNLEKKETRTPDIRDPNQEYLCCKHVHAVYDFIGNKDFFALINVFYDAYRLKKKSKGRKSFFAGEQEIQIATFDEVLACAEDYLLNQGHEERWVKWLLSSLNEENAEDELAKWGVFVNE